MNDLNDKCPWPHFVDTPICVYDRDSYDKYQTGEYQLPKRCICGATLVYDKPVTLCLVEHGKTVGEMLLELEYPLTFIRTDILEEQRVADACNKHSGPQKGVAGEIVAQRWSEDLEQVLRSADLEQVLRSAELARYGNEGESYDEMMVRRRAEAPKGVKDRVKEAIDKIRECARSVTPDPDPKEAARLAYYDAEQILLGAFGLELEFGTDEGWPPRVSMGCPIPKVKCPTCKQEVRPPHIPKSMLRACIFCGEDHAYHECSEYPEQRAAAMKEAREMEKADLNKEDK